MLTSGFIVFVVFVCLNKTPAALLGEHNEALIGGLFETAMIICGIDDPCERQEISSGVVVQRQEILGCRSAATRDLLGCRSAATRDLLGCRSAATRDPRVS